MNELSGFNLRSDSFFIMWLLVRFAPLGARQKNHPLCGCASKVIPKKLRTRYNKGVQANCKAKGEKYGTKRLIVYRTQSGTVSITLCSPLSINEKIIYNQYRSSLDEIFHRLCSYKGVWNYRWSLNARTCTYVSKYST